MKRSEINKILKDAVKFANDKQFLLPPFAFWGRKEWQSKGNEYDEIKDNMLGWDITDFGSGDYEKVGLLMFTLRNGNFNDPKYTKSYCEKLLISKVGQITPFHYHYKKMEDIINRGGGVLAMQLYNSTPDGQFADTDVKVSQDGRNYFVKAGSIIKIKPGESVTYYPGIYHQFWAEEEPVLIGEVSKVNDDRVDNHFYSVPGRFPKIEEDEEPLYLMSMDYSDIKVDW